MSPEKVNLPEQPENIDKDIASKESLQKGGEKLSTEVGIELKKIDPKVNKVVNDNIQSNKPENLLQIDKVDNNKEKTSNSQEKVDGIIDRGIIESKEPISFKVGSRVYQSIDNYNPPIDSSKDNSKQLQALFIKSREESNTAFIENQIKPQSLEENKKIEEIIRGVYLKNKPAIDKELGITNLENLTPQQAAKISSLVTMSKLDYDYTQAINPNDTNNYLDKLSPEQQVIYKKDYYISKVMESLNTNKDFHSQDKNGYFKKVFDYLHSSLSKDFGDISFDDMDKNSIVYANKILKDSGFGKEKLSKEAILDNPTTTNIYASLSDTLNRNDSKKVSTLLKDGKGVCRNYGAANEAIFNVLKGMQNPDNNMLKSSILTINTGNNSDGSTKANIADTEEATNNHLWNELQTIGSDGNIYVSQIDPTMSDYKKESNIDKVKTLDKTYDRLLNDLANNTDKEDFNQVGVKIEDYISSISKEEGNENKVVSMNIKLYEYYKGLGDTKGMKRIEKNLINSKMGDDLNTRAGISNTILNGGIGKNNYKKAIQLLGSNALQTNEGLLYATVLSSYGGKKQEKAMFDRFLDKNPEYLNLDQKGKETFLINNYNQVSQFLINNGYVN